MSRSKRTHAIIPAKSRSRRFPGKNKALLNGVPLYLRAVRYAKEKECIPVVFTDSEEIKEGSEKEGAIVYPQTEDQYEGYDAILPAIDALDIERMLLLQATCPFHAPGVLEEMENLMDKTGVKSVYTSEEVKVNGHIGDVYRKAIKMEDCPLHRYDGNLILCTPDFFLSHGNYFLGQESLYIPNRFPYTWDIDYEEELIFAEHLIHLYGLEEEKEKEEERKLLLEWDEKGCPYRLIREKNILMPLEYKKGYTILYLGEKGKEGGYHAETINGMSYVVEEAGDVWIAIKERDGTVEEGAISIEVIHPKWRRVLNLYPNRKRGEVAGMEEGFDILEFIPDRILRVKWDRWGEEAFRYSSGVYRKEELL